MPRPCVFLAYPFKTPDIETAVRTAVEPFADVVVAKDEVQGSHILDKILRQMDEASICLFDLTGSNTNVVLELGIAIGRRGSYCLLRNVAGESDPIDFFSDLKGWDHLRYHDNDDLIGKLKEYIPKQLQRISAGSTATHETKPIETYASEINESRQEAAGQGGLLIPTYVCSMGLAIHPTEYTGARWTEDNERSVIDDARRTIQSSFPIEGTESAANLEDGYHVTTSWDRGANSRNYREYYRVRRDGLFVLVRVSPDDITEDRQYSGSDRKIGFGTLVGTLTIMAKFASALASSYDGRTTASIWISGLANHSLVDDLAEHPLPLGTVRPAHQDRIFESFSGNAEEFKDQSLDWSADVITKCLRALNFPATTSATKTVVQRYQNRAV